MKLNIALVLLSLLALTILQAPVSEPTYIPLGPDPTHDRFALSPKKNSPALVVNMIPGDMSDEQDQNGDPFLAVSPQDLYLIAAANVSSSTSKTIPLLLSSSDQGFTWTRFKAALDVNWIDSQTYCFSGTSNRLYGAISGNNKQGDYFSVLQWPDAKNAESAKQISSTTGIEVGNQPYIQARTYNNNEEIYVGELYLGHLNKVERGTAAIRVSTDGGTTFKLFGLESRPHSPAGQDAPVVRPALALRDHTVYVSFFRWRNIEGRKATGDVVVIRDDEGATGEKPFSVLTDSSDNRPGRLVETNRTFLLRERLGQQELGADLALAVDPTNSDIVYLSWGDDDPVTNTHQLHLRVSFDRGQNWSNDLLLIPSAVNPALTVTDDGTVGFLYQQLRSTEDGPTWETHIRQLSSASPVWSDILLSSFPTKIEPTRESQSTDPYLAFRLNLISYRGAMYGTFAAPNNPDSQYFPQGVRFQRTYANGKLFSSDGKREIGSSIDPYFFRISNSTTKTAYDVSPVNMLTPKSDASSSSLSLTLSLALIIGGALVSIVVLVWVVRRTPKKLDLAIEQRLRGQGASLVNYSGYLSAHFIDSFGNRIEEAKKGSQCFLRVELTQPEPAEQWRERIDIVDGRKESQVDFRIVIDSSDLKIEPERVLLTVAVGGEGNSIFDVTLPDEKCEARVFVQIYQRTTLVQVVSPIISVID